MFLFFYYLLLIYLCLWRREGEMVKRLRDQPSRAEPCGAGPGLGVAGGVRIVLAAVVAALCAVYTATPPRDWKKGWVNIGAC